MITLIKRLYNKIDKFILSSDTQMTNEFIDEMKGDVYFDMIDSRTQNFIDDIRNKLNEIHK